MSTDRLAEGRIEIAEVHYFALLQVEDIQHAVAVVSLYGRPHEELLARSSYTYYTAQHLRNTMIRVVPVKRIAAVVAMIPDKQYRKFIQDGTEGDRWQLVEKPGLHSLERVEYTDFLSSVSLHSHVHSSGRLSREQSYPPYNRSNLSLDLGMQPIPTGHGCSWSHSVTPTEERSWSSSPITGNNRLYSGSHNNSQFQADTSHEELYRRAKARIAHKVCS
ncbi:hypothetical protein M413DRAFT_447578 [Hebeloma cylindrosporum]|uniref:Uncharacterized protein n=1 Tax=Hebeloma cylindrosporum TaxID=76867 RepID=A0A0C3BQG0_HEBCY|nr:hypothetical protein M413DRAFT_447578 [Hebeloma cylindrosporum h7]